MIEPGETIADSDFNRILASSNCVIHHSLQKILKEHFNIYLTHLKLADYVSKSLILTAYMPF